MIKSKRLVVLAQCVGLALLSAQAYAIEKAPLESFIQTELDSTPFAGASVAVVYQNTPVVQRGFGLQDIANQVPVQADTAFRIASISKTFTTLAVLQQVEKGKLSLDDSIYKYLPDYQPKVLPGVSKAATVRDLLTHHSPISSGWYAGSEPVTHPVQALESIPSRLSDDYLVWDRREVMAYNNTAMALAGLIVSRVSGLSWPEYVEQHFFKPLNMTDAWVHFPSTGRPDNMAVSYEYGQVVPQYTDALLPAGSMITSSRDMSRYMQAILDSWNYDSHSIVSADLIQEVGERQNEEVTWDRDSAIGIGFFLEAIRGYDVIGHSGSLQGFKSEMLLIPELNLGVFVAVNDDKGNQLTDPLVRRLIEKVIDAEGIPSKLASDSLDKDGEYPPLQAGQYVFNGIWEVAQERDGTFTVTVPFISGPQTLYPQGNGVYTLESNDQFGLKVDQETGALYASARGFAYDYLAPLETTPWQDNFVDLIGAYQPANEGASIPQIGLDYDHQRQMLYVITSQGEVRPIKQVTDTLFQIQGYGRGHGMVLDFSEPGGVNALGYRFNKLEVKP